MRKIKGFFPMVLLALTIMGLSIFSIFSKIQAEEELRDDDFVIQEFGANIEISGPAVGRAPVILTNGTLTEDAEFTSGLYGTSPKAPTPTQSGSNTSTDPVAP